VKKGDRMPKLKPNYFGILGGILAFISSVLPWWAMHVGGVVTEASYSGQAYVYLYQTTATGLLAPVSASMNLWFGWTALVLVVIGGWLGVASSVTSRAIRRLLLALGGALLVCSIIVFAAGLQNQISNGTWATGFPQGAGIGLFSSGSYGHPGSATNYSTYLYFGFWLAVIAAIWMFAALTIKPTDAISTPPEPSPPAPV
jgi:hypothetical protein